MDMKEQAYTFLKGLHNTLDAILPGPVGMRERMEALVIENKNPSKIRENIFLYNVLPLINNYMQKVPGIGPDEARASMLCEYHKKVPALASENAFRRVGHAFSKNRKLGTDLIMEKWTSPDPCLPMNQAYPDFGFRKPFPYQIVFDAKYFNEPSVDAARKVLVEGAYEVMFYRGLPVTPPSSDGDPGWDYDFGCLLAYDASDFGVLAQSWASVNAKECFWGGANVYIMIIRGTGS
jgi:hypothetical protein